MFDFGQPGTGRDAFSGFGSKPRKPRGGKTTGFGASPGKLSGGKTRGFDRKRRKPRGGKTTGFDRSFIDTAAQAIARAASARQRDFKTVDSMLRDREAAAGNDRAQRNTLRDFSRNQARDSRPKKKRSGGSGGGGGNAVRGRARSGLTRANRRANRTDMLGDLLSQLMGSVNFGAPNMNFQNILDKNLDAINKAYDMERSVVLRGNKRARRITKRNREELEGMYSALSRAYNREANQQERQTTRDVQFENRIHSNQAQRAENLSDRLLRKEGNFAQSLGIEDALADELPRDRRGLQNEIEGINQERKVGKSIAKQRGRSEENFLTRGGLLAREEGIQQQQAQMEALRDFLFASRNDLSAIGSERQKAIAAARGSLAETQANLVQDHQNAVWDRLMDVAGFAFDVNELRADNRFQRMEIGLDRANLRNDVADTRFDNSMDLREFFQRQREAMMEQREDVEETERLTDDTPHGRIAQIIAENVGAGRGSRVMKVFNNFIGQPGIRAGRKQLPNGEVIDITPEEAMAMATQMAQRQGLGQQEQQALRIAVLDYFR